MLHETQQSPQLAHIQDIIRSKWWYSSTDSGGFDWQASVGNIATELRVDDPECIREAIESAFTPTSLTVVESEHPKPLIAAASELAEHHGGELFVWTVGDETWQRRKFERTGLDEYVDDDHYLVSPSRKIEQLREALWRISRRHADGQMIHVYVVDDKPGNLHEAMQLTSEFADKGVALHNYNMKIGVPEADATTCFKYLEGRVQAHETDGHKSVLVFDQDGVLVDTDRTLFNVGSRNILEAISSR